MNKTAEVSGRQFNHCIVFLLYLSRFIFAQQTDGKVNILICLIVQRAGSIEEKRIGRTIQFVAIERSDECFLFVRHFRIFDDVDILFLQFLHNGSEYLLKLLVVTIVQLPYLFQSAGGGFLFCLYVFIGIFYDPVLSSYTDTEEFIQVI